MDGVRERLVVSRTITLTAEDVAKLERLARLSGRSQSQVVRLLVRRARVEDLAYVPMAVEDHAQ